MWHCYPVWYYVPTYTHCTCPQVVLPPPYASCQTWRHCPQPVTVTVSKVDANASDPDRFVQAMADAFKNIAAPHGPK